MVLGIQTHVLRLAQQATTSPSPMSYTCKSFLITRFGSCEPDNTWVLPWLDLWPQTYQQIKPANPYNHTENSSSKPICFCFWEFWIKTLAQGQLSPPRSVRKKQDHHGAHREYSPQAPTHLTQGPQHVLEQALSWSGNTAAGCEFRTGSGLLGMKTSAFSFRLADKIRSILLPMGKQWILSATEHRNSRAFLSDICLPFAHLFNQQIFIELDCARNLASRRFWEYCRQHW